MYLKVKADAHFIPSGLVVDGVYLEEDLDNCLVIVDFEIDNSIYAAGSSHNKGDIIDCLLEGKLLNLRFTEEEIERYLPDGFLDKIDELNKIKVEVYLDY